MRKLSLLALVLGFAACRDSSGGDTQGTDTNTTGNDTKIQDIQDPAMTNGTPVTVKGVVVTAIDNYGGKTGDFWIQEPEGGEFSGIHVYGAPLDQVAALAVGDVVDVSGAEKDDFAYSAFDPGFAITELKPLAGGVMTVAKTGANMVLQPQVVNALMIGGLPDFMARAAEWEKWEGVLIKIENVSASDDQKCVGSMCTDSTLQKVQVTGDVVIESALAPFPETNASATGAVDRGECLASVTGVLDYFFDYLLLPRTTSEYVLTGGTCPTEDSMSLCGDGMDNDGNGFMDCADNSCVVASTTCRMAYDITDLQPESATITMGVDLQDVRVVAHSYNKEHIWVQMNQAAAPNEGIYVRGTGNKADLTTFAVGSRVDIIGRAVEFNDMTGTDTLTQVQAYSITAGTGATQTPTPVTGQTAATLAVALTGEPYEGVLVTLSDVRISTASIPCTGGATPPACNYGLGEAKQLTTTFKIDDDILAGAAGCYATITGLWTYLPYENVYGFLPKTLGATGSNCPL